MKNEEAIQKILTKCSHSTKLRDFYKNYLNENFYRNKLMFDAIREEETLIGMVTRYSKYMVA